MTENTSQGSMSFFHRIDPDAIGTTGWSNGACASVEAAAGVASRHIPADSRIQAIMPMELCRYNIITVDGVSKRAYQEVDIVGMDGLTIPDSDLRKVRATFFGWSSLNLILMVGVLLG